jgi:4,5-DOPA dioxygenase extradiol
MKRTYFLKLLAATPLAAYAMNLNELHNLSSGFEKTNRLPVLFVGHGNPMNALLDNPFTKSLKKTGEDLRSNYQINAILVVSAHWLTKGSFVQASAAPETIHDFGGFPQELFDAEYNAPGSPDYAIEVPKLAPVVKTTTDWGLDHGAWTILMHLFPKADIPVFQLSIDYYDKPMDYHFKLAQQLKALRERGVLIIGSGNVVHNLRMSMEALQRGDEKFVYDWATEFDTWVGEKLSKGDYASLTDYTKAGNAGLMSVPTPDHYIPMLYSLGLANPGEEFVNTYEELTFGGISMRTFKIG